MQYENVYKQMERRERYLYEQDRINMVYYYHSERELYKLCPNLYDTERLAREAEYDRCMRRAMYLALEDLAELNPKWYMIIIDYYFGESVSKSDLGAKYGTTRQAVGKTLNKALALLKRIAKKHLERLLSE